MSETYCGKSCESCSWKYKLNCPGCQKGPGRPIEGDCDIARCCRNKSHNTCATCSDSSYCAKWRGRADEPKYRMERIEQEKEDDAYLHKMAPMLAKWLWIIFCLSIIAVIAGLATSNAIKERVPNLYIGGTVISTVTKIVISLILIKLTSVSGNFVKAGVYMIISSVLSLINIFIPDGEWTFELLSLLLTIPNLIMTLLSDYNLYTGYSNITVNADKTLAVKWDELWTWTKRACIMTIVATLLVVLAPLLGVILLLIAMIAMFIIGIVRLVYQYQSAMIFRSVSNENVK